MTGSGELTANTNIMDEKLCSQGHVIAPSQERCDRCNGLPVNVAAPAVADEVAAPEAEPKEATDESEAPQDEESPKDAEDSSASSSETTDDADSSEDAEEVAEAPEGAPAAEASDEGGEQAV